MKNFILFAVILFLLCSCAGLETTKNLISGAELIDYGLLNINIEKTIDRTSTASGKYNVADVESVKMRTDIIHLAKNETFGIIYKVSGSPEGANVVLTAKAIHPPIKGRTVSTAKVWAKIGETSNSFYTFNEDYELVEGDWKIQIWNKKQLLVEKAFVVQK